MLSSELFPVGAWARISPLDSAPDFLSPPSMRQTTSILNLAIPRVPGSVYHTLMYSSAFRRCAGTLAISLGTHGASCTNQSLAVLCQLDMRSVHYGSGARDGRPFPLRSVAPGAPAPSPAPCSGRRPGAPRHVGWLGVSCLSRRTLLLGLWLSHYPGTLHLT